MLLVDVLTLKILFFILAPVVVFTLVFFFIVLPLRERHIKNHFREYCYKKIYKVAFDEDYYLINNFSFKVDGKLVCIDHILFGNKYFYVIIDTYLPGDLIGKENDNSLILIDRHNRKYYTENQFQTCKALMNYLKVKTGIDKDLLIGISIVNNDCKVGVESNSKQFYIIQRNKLKKLVKAIESRDVKKINEQEMDCFVKSLDEMNRKKK